LTFLSLVRGKGRENSSGTDRETWRDSNEQGVAAPLYFIRIK